MKSVPLRRIAAGFLIFSGSLGMQCRGFASVPLKEALAGESLPHIEQHIEQPEFARQSPVPDLGQRVLERIRSANAGDAEAQYLVGLCCLAGFGMKKNALEAGQWFEKAAAQGSVKAKYQLGYMLVFSSEIKNNLPAGARLLREAAELGDIYAQSATGFVLEQGLGVPANPAQAVEWYKKAAGRGVAEAQ